MFSAGVQFLAESGQNFHQHRHRVGGAMRIGDMSLAPAHHQFTVQAAAPADLDGVAQRLHAGWLANQAIAGQVAVSLHPLQHFDRSVDRRAFLVAGDNQAD